MDDFDRLMEIQRMTASNIRQESEVDNKIKVLEILADLSVSNKRIQIEEIIIEAGIRGLTESEVMNTLKQLESDRIIKRYSDGYIEMT